MQGLKRMVALLDIKPLRAAVLEGLVASIGGLDGSLSAATTSALVQWLAAGAHTRTHTHTHTHTHIHAAWVLGTQVLMWWSVAVAEIIEEVGCKTPLPACSAEHLPCWLN